jgi:hypothetical protein
MKSKPQGDKIDQRNIDLGQKEAAMEKLGKDKMDHMGSGKKSPAAGEKAKPRPDDPMRH